MDSIITISARFEIRDVICFLQVEGHSTDKIHRWLCCVYNESVMSELCKGLVWEIRGLPHWYAWQRKIRTTLKMATSETVFKFDEAMCERRMTPVTLEVYCETLNKLQWSIQNKRRRILIMGVVLMHDKARPHTVACTKALLEQFTWVNSPQSSYSPGLTPSDYYLFRRCKSDY